MQLFYTHTNTIHRYSHCDVIASRCKRFQCGVSVSHIWRVRPPFLVASYFYDWFYQYVAGIISSSNKKLCFCCWTNCTEICCERKDVNGHVKARHVEVLGISALWNPHQDKTLWSHLQNDLYSVLTLTLQSVSSLFASVSSLFASVSVTLFPPQSNATPHSRTSFGTVVRQFFQVSLIGRKKKWIPYKVILYLSFFFSTSCPPSVQNYVM